MLAVLAAAITAYAISASTATASTTLSQGYTTSQELAVGTMVSLQKNSSDEVIPSSTTNTNNILGVVISPNTSLLSISNEKSQVQVATSGTLEVLASDVNGAIRRGDHITASPISGVGMKATGNVLVLGIAQSDLDGNGSKQTYKDKSGKESSAYIGTVPVLINVAYYFKQPEKTVVPGALQNVANAIAGKAVNTTPIIISAAIFLVTVLVVMSIIYTMIRSSIISVGRNPMSQSAIYRNVIQLSSLVLLILAVGFSSIYLVLTRL
jgi:hypothetical protein